MSARRVLRAATRCTRGCAVPYRISRLLSTTLRAREAAPASSPPEHGSPTGDRPTHFGFQTVTEAEKTERVAGVFASVAESYDRMNDLMSFGWHRVWKDHFVSSLSPGLSAATPPSPQHILDVAGGTGDIAFRMLHHAHVLNRNPDVRVTISDINPAMLAVGRQRAQATLPAGQQAALSFVEANAEDLTRGRRLSVTSAKSPAETTMAEGPSDSSAEADSTNASGGWGAGIPSSSVDLYTVAFGIRNFSNIPSALREAYRVLRPGGVFACLEFSKVVDSNPLGALFDAAYRRWSFGAIPLLGQLVAGDRDSYQYLVESIERFPSQEEFRDMIVDAGFVISGRGFENLTGGVAAIHKGMKPLDSS